MIKGLGDASELAEQNLQNGGKRLRKRRTEPCAKYEKCPRAEPSFAASKHIGRGAEPNQDSLQRVVIPTEPNQWPKADSVLEPEPYI